MMHFKSIALVGKYQSVSVNQHIMHLANYLQNKGIRIYVENGQSNNDNKILQNFEVISLSSYTGPLDLVIVIGGDGTLLASSRMVVNRSIPVIGINQGHLGFMTDVLVSDMIAVMDKILFADEYLVEERAIIEAKVLRDNQCVYGAIAINDVVISRGAVGSMIEFEISIDDEFVLSQKSDGVIFATPTGSTAYSLAAGGPIIQPKSNVFSIVPICPQSMTNRPLVVDDRSLIKFRLIKNNSTLLHFDGQECFDLKYQDEIFLTRYSKPLYLIHPKDYNYYHTLRNKLDWSKRVS